MTLENEVSVGPEVSVIIPVFNSERTIRRAVESVIAQTISDFEIIVIDDGSTDHVVDLIAQWGIDGLRVIRHPQNCGAAAARNTGIAAARGRWIAFLNSDDTWKPEKLARQTTILKQAANLRITACATGYNLYKYGRKLTINLKLSPDNFRREILFGCSISPGTTLMVDRRMFNDDEIGKFDERLRRLEDWDWLLRFAMRYEMEFLPEPLADVYVTDMQASQMKMQFNLVIDALDRISRKHLPHLKGMERLQLRSSLLVEKAAMLYRVSKPLSAVVFVLASGFIYPFRNAAFCRTLWRSVRRLFGQ